MKVSLEHVTPNAEQNIIKIARVSSSRKDKTKQIAKLIKYLAKNAHWSPFEHSHMTVEIQTSRAIGAQLLRHRSFTFQEFSQRYAEVIGIENVQLRKQAETNRQSSTEEFDPYLRGHAFTDDYSGKASVLIDDHFKQAQELYDKLIYEGVAKECARMILPLATSTTIYMTGNARSWIHFFQVRDDEHAQLEIQLIAKEIKKIFIEHFPNTSEALGYI